MAARLKKDWGTLTACSYLGELDQSIMRDFIWKCTFDSKDDAGKAMEILVREMENAASLSVPLEVAAQIGDNWDACHG